MMFLCAAGMAIAQEETKFEMFLGDTLVWTPFGACDNLGYNISEPKLIGVTPLHYGEKVEVIANRIGKCYIVASCNDDTTQAILDIVIKDPNEAPVVVEMPVKPATMAFTGLYQFNPPKDNYFITITDMGNQRKETFVKIGDIEAHNDGVGYDRFWNVKTGKVWYYCPDAQGWTDDVDWEFEPLDESCLALNSFEKEVKDKSNLSNYYVGMEKVLEVNCWYFFVEIEDNVVIQYWVDPSNGCTLKRQFNAEPAKMVTVYDLNYTKLYFGPSFKKGLHDTRR